MRAEFAGTVEHDDHEGAKECGAGEQEDALGNRLLLGAGLVMVMDVACAIISAIIGAMRRRERASFQ